VRDRDTLQDGLEVSEIPKTAKPLVKVAGFLLMGLILAGGVAVYLSLAQHSELAGTLPLPAPLKTVSKSHEELMLYGRALQELAVDAGNRLPDLPTSKRPAGPRLQARLATLHATGRALEPKVSRTESRALMAFQRAESNLKDFVFGVDEPSYSRDTIETARRQIAIGLELGRGKEVDETFLAQQRKHAIAPKKKGLGGVDFNLLKLPDE
jgi:hypothetical protein